MGGVFGSYKLNKLLIMDELIDSTHLLSNCILLDIRVNQ